MMDKKKFLALLRNLQSIMKCPACGAVYNVEEIQFVGNQDGYFLLSMTCSSCNLPVWVNFFTGNRQASVLTDLTINDIELAQKPAIRSDEVIDFHLFLNKFDGNFKKHINKAK